MTQQHEKQFSALLEYYWKEVSNETTAPLLYVIVPQWLHSHYQPLQFKLRAFHLIF